MSSTFNDEKKLSATALSQHCRGRDSDWIISCSPSMSVNSVLVYWANSTGRRNTSIVEVLMATMKERQRAVQVYRGQIPSPGRPTVAWRQDRVQFWAAIARGAKTEDAAVEAGVSSPVAFRWFRHAGGVNPCLPLTVSGRYVSFAEREDIALFRAQGLGVREIARRLNRSPS